MDELLAALCLQSQRVYIQITQFRDESSYFKGCPFVIDGKDIPSQLRNDLIKLKSMYQKNFKNPIPVLNEHGALIFDAPVEQLSASDTVASPRKKIKARKKSIK